MFPGLLIAKFAYWDSAIMIGQIAFEAHDNAKPVKTGFLAITRTGRNQTVNNYFGIIKWVECKVPNFDCEESTTRNVYSVFSKDNAALRVSG